MHEIGVVMEVVKAVEDVVREQQLSRVDKIVLQIGEFSSMIPQYVESCYPAAVDGTSLEETKLEIEILPGNSICKDCKKVYPIGGNGKICPSCGSRNTEILCGREFMIKEIVAC